MINDKFKIVDFHSHILPKVDHGSTSLQTSLKQLMFAKDAGVSRVVATPHYYPNMHNLNEFIERRNRACVELFDALVENEHPQILIGAEVLLCEKIDRLPGLDNLCIEDTSILLIELPSSNLDSMYLDTVNSLIKRGYDIVLAHAERYSARDIDRLISLGAKVQINAHVLNRFLMPKKVLRWLKNGNVVALGSDIHGADQRAYKRLTKAFCKYHKHIKNII